MESTASDWVSETAFGKWFLSTDTWLRYVLTPAARELRELAAPHLPNRPLTLLDAGCGQGRAFSVLHRQFAPARIIGIDIDRKLLVGAERAASECSIDIEVRRGNVSALDLPDASVDVVFCHQLVHHVVAQTGTLRELQRVLAPDGLLLLSESCASFIDTWPVRWLFRHPDQVQRSAEGYLTLLREVGFVFTERDVRTSTPWWSLPDFGVRRRLGLPYLVPADTELLVVAQKHAAR